MDAKEKRKTSSAMAEHMQRYPESGMTQRAYCEAHGISKATFGYWLKKHRSGHETSTGSFVRVNPKRKDCNIEIEFTNGMVITVPGIGGSKVYQRACGGMIGLDQKRRYFLYVGITDIRKSFDGLSGLVTNEMKGTITQWRCVHFSEPAEEHDLVTCVGPEWFCDLLQETGERGSADGSLREM